MEKNNRLHGMRALFNLTRDSRTSVWVMLLTCSLHLHADDNTFIYPAYEDTTIGPARLGIVMQREPYVEVHLDFSDIDLGTGNIRRKSAAYMQKYLQMQLSTQGKFTKCRYDSIVSRGEMTYREMSSEEGLSGWYFYTPRDSGIVTTGKGQYDYLLFITSFRLMAKEVSHVHAGGSHSAGWVSSSETLIMTCRFLFWDVKQRRPVSLGIVEIEDNGDLEPSEIDEAAEELVEDMLDDSPFEK